YCKVLLLFVFFRDLSNDAGDQDKEDTGSRVFSVRRWFRLLQAALSRAGRRRDEETARTRWKPQKPLYPSRKDKSVILKRRRVAEQIQICFEKLSGPLPGRQSPAPCSFRFSWGSGEADGPSLHQQTLDGVVTLENKVLVPSNTEYWHLLLRCCKTRNCSSHYQEVEPTLPRSYAWLLELLSFLLDVRPACVFEEVLSLERRLLRTRDPERERKTPERKTPRTETSRSKTPRTKTPGGRRKAPPRKPPGSRQTGRTRRQSDAESD
uniref:TATA box-binding protein-associated factor RNA polymerase I subunit B-like n=1 Tax=Centroberyx gerrardi TaxID=166262 RepID=UPI003AAE66A4